jgi:hypothetical protein
LLHAAQSAAPSTTQNVQPELHGLSSSDAACCTTMLLYQLPRMCSRSCRA